MENNKHKINLKLLWISLVSFLVAGAIVTGTYFLGASMNKGSNSENGEEESEGYKGLKFTAEDILSEIKFTFYDEFMPIPEITVQYSTDINGENWTDWNADENIELRHVGDFIYVRTTSDTLDNSEDQYINFKMDGKIKVSGDISSLINFGELSEYSYYGIFQDCEGLTNAKDLKLSSETLEDFCYTKMFSGCTNLITAPELPATELAAGCYMNMFSGCTNLITAPELPATELANYCYSAMFTSCEKITTPPELPAMELTIQCYTFMFGYCTSLTSAPELKATTLKPVCYYGMFNDCTSLKVNENGTGTKIFKCPPTDNIDNPVDDMFNGTIGNVTTPTADNTYYWTA